MTTNLTALYGLGGGDSFTGRWKSQTFTTSGIWRRPAGVEVVKVLLVGGGASGFGNNGWNPGGQSSFGDLVVARGGTTNGFGGGGGPNFPVLSSVFGVAGGRGGLTQQFSPAVLSESIIGFGTGGQGVGGGASYGNGANGLVASFTFTGIGTDNSGIWTNTVGLSAEMGSGGGGGGLSTPSTFAGGTPSAGGGGGGEIVLREVPVSSDQVVSIGAGGERRSFTATATRQVSITELLFGVIPVRRTVTISNTTTVQSGAGGSGRCVIFWQE